MSVSTLIGVIFIAIILAIIYILFEYTKLKNEIKTKHSINNDFETDKIKEINLIANVIKVPDITQRGELFKKSYERKFSKEINSNNDQKEAIVNHEIIDNTQKTINKKVSIADLKKDKKLIKSYNNTDIDYMKAVFFTCKNTYSDNI